MASGSGEAGDSRFAALGVDAFRLIWAGTLLYFLAIFSQMIARGWLARELTGTNAGLGAVNLAFGVASLVSTPLGGVLADRFDKRRILVVATAALAASAALMAAAVIADIVAFWMLLVASAIEAVVFSALVPARMALAAASVGPALLHNAVVLSQVSMNANRIVGPALAGAMLAVSWLGVSGVYVVGVVACVVATVVFAKLPRDIGRVRPAVSAGATARPRTRPIAAMVDGVRYAHSQPLLGRLLLVSLIVTMFGFSYVTFLPTVADEFFDSGSGGYAALSVVSAVGGLAASVAIAGKLGATRGWAVQGVSGMGFALGVISLGLARTFATALVVSLFLGAAVAGFQSMNATIVLTHAESSYHGRMQSLLQLGFSAFGIASLPLGALADAVGLRAVFVAMGAICGVTVLAAQRSPALRPAPAANPTP